MQVISTLYYSDWRHVFLLSSQISFKGSFDAGTNYHNLVCTICQSWSVMREPDSFSNRVKQTLPFFFKYRKSALHYGERTHELWELGDVCFMLCSPE